jgi:hypothetical protein
LVRCSIVELRQYTLHPGARDVLIDLFEREFLETQEAAGMTLIGQFRAIDDPDRFVWLRGFDDMKSRAAALASFYGGPTWAAHRSPANATMIDSDNVLLLRPVHAQARFEAERGEPFPRGSESESSRVYLAVTHYFRAPEDVRVAEVEAAAEPAVSAGAGVPLAWLVSEQSRNDYPALPVRDDVNAVVWIAAFPDALSADACIEELQRLADRPEVLKLAPTPRSRLR